MRGEDGVTGFKAEARMTGRAAAAFLLLSILSVLVVAACGSGTLAGTSTPTILSVTATAAAVSTATLVPASPTGAVATPSPAMASPTGIAGTGTTVPTPSLTVGQPTVAPRFSPGAAGTGVLTGRASIGPLTPVERIGVPSPTPSPQICTARGLAIYNVDGTTLVTSFSFQPDCSYQVSLSPGTYVVKLRDGQPGIGGARDLPKTVTIESGRTAVLDIAIDTGIR